MLRTYPDNNRIYEASVRAGKFHTGFKNFMFQGHLSFQLF